MKPALARQEDLVPPAVSAPLADSLSGCGESRALSPALPPAVAAAVWRGDQLGQTVDVVVASGHAALDAELPGGGWPCGHLTEILCAQSGVLEWRLLSPMLEGLAQEGRDVVVIGPPRQPHPPGLRLAGVHERQLVWIRAETPAERLWTTEQLLKARTGAVVLTWLPQVRAEQLRRLQVLAAGGTAPVFVCRPATAAAESSAAPLRVLARVGADWTLALDILKRKGPPLGQTLHLPSVPGGLAAMLPPRLRQLAPRPVPVTQQRELAPVAETASVESDHALVRSATGRSRRRAALAVRRA